MIDYVMCEKEEDEAETRGGAAKPPKQQNDN